MLTLLLLLAAPADATAMMKTAARRLTACEGEGCAAPARPSPYRIARDDEGPAAPTAKDRAFRDDGTRCAVVGARMCTRKPRTIFSTGLGD